MILSYERRSHFPTHIGNARLRVDDDGAVCVQVNREEPPLDQAWSSEFPAEPIARLDDARGRIAAVLDRHDFAALPARTEADRDDGYEERLTWWRDDGSSHSVVADGGSLPALRALLGELFAMLGVTDRVA